MPSAPQMKRKYDLVVLGATGFTGRLVVDYLLKQFKTQPALFKWAIAGRSLDKLKAVVAELGAAKSLPCLIADSSDFASLKTLAQQCKVIITTVGPYKELGSTLVQACSTSGKLVQLVLAGCLVVP
jgi:short subunit dehydrogenase-like uncharacterized protein